MIDSCQVVAIIACQFLVRSIVRTIEQAHNPKVAGSLRGSGTRQILSSLSNMKPRYDFLLRRYRIEMTGSIGLLPSWLKRCSRV
jgi:hypothetical protein